MLAVLRQRNFALVWLAGLISLTGDWFLLVALPFSVYGFTGSNAATAATVASRVLPRFLLSSVAGLYVDRWDRRRTMVIANLLLGVAILPLILVRTADWLWLLYSVSLVQSALAQFVSPAKNALLPRLVAEQDLVPANALNGLSENFALLVGPALGGLVTAAWGLTGATLLDAASFAIAAALVSLVAADSRAVRAAPSPTTPDEFPSTWAGAWIKVWREWLAGLMFVRRDRIVATIFLFWVIGGLGEGVFSSLLVPFVSTVLGADSFGYGLVVGAQAVGGVVGSIAIGRVGRRLPPERLFALGAIGVGTIDLLTFNAHRLFPGIPVPIILMIIVGLPAAGVGIGYTTLLQRVVPDEFRGRVFGSLMAAISLALLIGSGVAGALGNRVDITTMLSVQAISFPLAGLFALLTLSPDIITRSERAQAKPEASS
ncbi:MAG: MFS transporter [Chloroflexia bacterium]